MRQGVILAVLTLVNLVCGFASQWILLRQLGASASTDALYASAGLPMFLVGIVSGPLFEVLVPNLARQPEEEFLRDTWTYSQVVGGFSLLIGLALALTASLWLRVVAPGFSSEQVDLAADLARIQIVGIVLTSFSSIQTAAVLARGRFVTLEVIQVVSNIVGIVILILLLPLYGIRIAAWTFTARILLQSLMVVPLLLPYRLPSWDGKKLAGLWYMVKPMMLGSMYYKSGPLIDRFLASFAPVGSITLFHTSQQIYSGALAISIKSICSPVVPRLAQSWRDGRVGYFRELLRKRVSLAFGLSGLGYLAVVVGGRPLLHLVFGSWKFTGAEVDELWLLLALSGGIFVVGSAAQLVTTAFYAAGETAKPTKVGVQAFTLGVVSKALLFVAFGVTGMAAGVSLWYIAAYALMARELRRHLSQLESHAA